MAWQNPRAGSAEFDPATGVYRVSGGGANIWNRLDAFHYVWRRMSGDLTLTANVRWAQPLPTTDRKAGLMVRQSLAPDAPYADGMVHGRALTALQYRETQKATTESTPVGIAAPIALRLERRGNAFRLWAAPVGTPLEVIGTTDVLLRDPVYVGLAVCAHNPAHLEEAIFSDVRITNSARNFAQRAAPVESSLEVISADGKERKLVYRPHGGIGGYYGNGLGNWIACNYAFTAANDPGGPLSHVTRLIPGKPERRPQIHPVPLNFCAPVEDFLCAWKLNGWNQFHIRSVGTMPRLTASINGVKISELDTSQVWKHVPGWSMQRALQLIGPAGHIALEVHSNGPHDWLGKERWWPGNVCRWRNISIKAL